MGCGSSKQNTGSTTIERHGARVREDEEVLSDTLHGVLDEPPPCSAHTVSSPAGSTPPSLRQPGSSNSAFESEATMVVGTQPSKNPLDQAAALLGTPLSQPRSPRQDSDTISSPISTSPVSTGSLPLRAPNRDAFSDGRPSETSSLCWGGSATSAAMLMPVPMSIHSPHVMSNLAPWDPAAAQANTSNSVMGSVGGLSRGASVANMFAVSACADGGDKQYSGSDQPTGGSTLHANSGTMDIPPGILPTAQRELRMADLQQLTQQSADNNNSNDIASMRSSPSYQSLDSASVSPRFD